MSDHTEGPWKVSRRFDIYSDRGPLVGGTYIGTTRGNAELPKSVELTDEANARLIAAAPDLLAACKAFQHAMESYGHIDKTDRLIANAVKKAEGDE